MFFFSSQAPDERESPHNGKIMATRLPERLLQECRFSVCLLCDFDTLPNIILIFINHPPQLFGSAHKRSGQAGAIDCAGLFEVISQPYCFLSLCILGLCEVTV